MRSVERAWFLLCLALGRLLRSARYSTVRIDGDARLVRKRRTFFARLLVWLGGPLARVLNTGVRVLPQREWEERERAIYRIIYGASIAIEAGGTLVLPWLAGRTLAAWLEDPAIDEGTRNRAIELAVDALAAFHDQGFTHGDAMAENVLVHLSPQPNAGHSLPNEPGAAHWIDFETVHDARRPMVWRRADDLRALLATCVVRTAPDEHAGTVRRILHRYPDEEVIRVLAANFTSVWRRSLAFHLAQAPFSFQCFREIGRLPGLSPESPPRRASPAARATPATRARLPPAE